MSLPSLVLWSGNLADLPNYLEDIYARFMKTFVRAEHTFLGGKVTARWSPSFDNKHFSFWHVISEQAESGREEDRTPDFKRCERVEWIGYVLANSNDRTRVLCWLNERQTSRGADTRYLLYLHEERYIIVLSKRGDGFLLVTAYHVNERRHAKFLVEHRASKDPRDYT